MEPQINADKKKIESNHDSRRFRIAKVATLAKKMILLQLTIQDRQESHDA